MPKIDKEEQYIAQVEDALGTVFHLATEIEAPDKAPKCPVKHKKWSALRMGPGRPRPSGFPYCPLVHLHKDATKDLKTTTLNSSFYLSVGTAVHETLQRFLGLTGYVWGNYGCPKCKKFHVSTDPFCPYCAAKGKGKIECQYHELEHEYGNIVAHIDGLVDLGPLGLWVIDYKTIAKMKLVHPPTAEHMTLPYMKNQHQCAAYVPVIEQLMQRPIAGFALIYVSRDTPDSRRVYAVPMPKRKKKLAIGRLNQYSQEADVAHSYIKRRDPIILKQLIDNRCCKSTADNERLDHMGCSLKQLCLPADLSRAPALLQEHLALPPLE